MPELKKYFKYVDAKEAAEQKNHVVFSCDLNDSQAKVFHTTTFKKYVRFLKKNKGIYETFVDDPSQPVKFYLDIDDWAQREGEEDVTEQESEAFVKELVRDFKLMYGIFGEHVVITSHGISKGKMKFSYSIIFNQYHVQSVAHVKKAVEDFLKEHPSYNLVLDTQVYKSTQLFRAVNQSKKGDLRVNTLRTNHSIEDTIISHITENSQLCYISLNEQDVIQPPPHFFYEVTNMSSKLVQKIVMKLPQKFAEDRDTWFQIASFIKSFSGDEEIFKAYSSQSTKFDLMKDMKTFDSARVGVYTPSTFFGYLVNTDCKFYGGMDVKNKVLAFVKPLLVALQPEFDPLPLRESDIVVNERYTPLLPQMLKDKCTILEASQGCGKTTLATAIYKKKHNRRMLLCIVSRQSMASTIVTSFKKENVKVYNYLDLKKDQFNHGNVRRLVIQVDSIIHLKRAWWSNCVLLIDEVCSLLKYVAFSNTLIERRREVFNSLCFLIRKSHKMMCMDADLSPMVLNFLQTLNIKYNIYRNTFRPMKGKEVYITNAFPEFETMIRECDKTNGLWIVADSKQGLEELVERLELSDVVFFTSTAFNRGCLESINESCAGRIVCISPKILYGVSFESELKVPVFGYFTKMHLSPSEKVQQLRRVRNPGSIVVYDSFRAKNLRKYINADDVHFKLNEEASCDLFAKFNGEFVDTVEGGKQVDTIFRKLYCDALYEDDWMRADPFRTLKSLLTRGGLQVVLTQEKRKRVKKQTKGNQQKALYTQIDAMLQRVLDDEVPVFTEDNDPELWESIYWRLRSEGLPFDLEKYPKETKATIRAIWSFRTDFYENYLFQKRIFRRAMNKECIDTELVNKTLVDFNKPILDSLLAKVNVVRAMASELGLSKWNELPSVEDVSKNCTRPCNLIKLCKANRSTKSKTANYIDRLFKFSRSIKDISKPYGWKRLYMRYLKIIRIHAGVKMKMLKNLRVNDIRISVYEVI